MKKIWFQRFIPLLLVASFLISIAEPVSAASITGNVPVTGVLEMGDLETSRQALPDRIRCTYSFTPSLNDYWATRVISDGSVTSFDISSSVRIDTDYGSTGGYHVTSLYPGGRYYYKLPCPVSALSSTDYYLEFLISSRYFYYNGSSTSYYSGSYGTDYGFFDCYDQNFNLISSVSCTLTSTTVSGSASGSSYPLVKFSFSGSLSFPSGTVYVVPYYKSQMSYYKGSKNQYYADSYISDSFSFTFRCDVLDNFFVDGIWEAKSSSPTVKDPITEKVNFTSGGIQYDTIDYSYRLPTGVHREQHNLTYSSGASSFQVRGDGWFYDSGKVIDFGSDPQRVSPDFYAFLIDHFTRISNSPELGESVNLKIYDYSGMNLLGSVDVSDRVLVGYSTFIGSPYDLMIIDYGTDPDSTDDDQVLYRISFGQTTNFITGVALRRYGLPVSTDGDDYFSQFVLYSGAELYVMREGDQIGGVIDPDDPAFGGIEGDTLLYDHSGSTLLDSFAGLFPVTIQVKENGFHILDWAEDISTWQYVYDGPGTFAGLSTMVDDTVVRYGPGSSFTLVSPSSIYLITEEDIDDSGQDPDEDPTDPPDPGGDTDPTDPSDPDGDSDPTDPSVPGGSGGNTGGGSGGLGDLDGSGLDNSSGNVSNSGNKLDGVLGDFNNAEGGLPVLPDNFADIISSSLTDAADSEIWAFMPWYDEQYGFIWDIILVPTLAGLSACLLMYAVFGKAGSVG